MATDAGDVFTTILQSRAWTGGSGSGSHPANTESYRRFVEDYLRAERIERVLDVGCGDWQSSRLIDWGDIEYVGVDVVPAVVEANNRSYATETVRFVCLDVLCDVLPAADLVLLKDVFQHWPNELVLKFVGRLAEYRHVLITNTVESYDSPSFTGQRTRPFVNENIPMGGLRPVDLAAPPFGLPVTEMHRHLSVRWQAQEVEVKSTVRLDRSRR